MEPTNIAPLEEPTLARPFWSVMVPCYNARLDFLEQALRSVLDQLPPGTAVQIEVVDDCSPQGAPKELVERVGGGRIQLSRTPRNLGLAGCWNHCLNRARGHWVHLLHQDDFLLPGFYQKLAELANRAPEMALLATRSFYVDAQGVITGVSRRLPELEAGSRSPAVFFGGTHLQCPGVVIKREFYQQHGGFRADLVFVLDCEMWARAVHLGGGLVAPEVLSCYRISKDSETGRLARSAETLRDTARLNQLFAQRYPDFSLPRAEQELRAFALEQVQRFHRLGDPEAAAANLAYWNSVVPVSVKLRRPMVRLLKGLLRRMDS